VGDTSGARLSKREDAENVESETVGELPQESFKRSSDNGYVSCSDGKTRRIEPGIEPLVDGLPGRMGLLRGYGNAIVPQVAVAFINAYQDTHNKPTKET
jgi:DNA (cytosine-5)-methyltransferase 1